MASPKAQRTGGREYEPVDFPEGKLKKKLVALYSIECERQKALFEKFQAGGSEERCSMPLNGERDIKLADTLGICGPRIYGPRTLDQDKKNQIFRGPWIIDKKNRELLEEYLDDGNTFADLFASELIEIVRPCLKSAQAATLLSQRADLIKEAQSVQRKIELIIEDLDNLSPGIIWDDRLTKKYKDMSKEVAELFHGAVKTIEERGRKTALKDDIASIANEMSVQALQVFSRYNIAITASAEQIGQAIVYTSIAVDALTELHKAAGFPHSKLTINKKIKVIMQRELREDIEFIKTDPSEIN